MDWNRRFDDPILLTDGRLIETIGDAAKYATSLPAKDGNTAPWQAIAKVLQRAAEHGGPFVFIARISFCKAVFGEDGPAIGNPREAKGTKWRNGRKLARDR